MGAGASSGVQEGLAAASDEELRATLASLPDDAKAKLRIALDGANAAPAPARIPDAYYEKLGFVKVGPVSWKTKV
jgi:hypothetical protein